MGGDDLRPTSVLYIFTVMVAWRLALRFCLGKARKGSGRPPPVSLNSVTASALRGGGLGGMH